MTWAAAFTPVPRVLGHGADGEGSWLVPAALPGHSAVSPRWLADPRTAERAAAAGRLDTSDWAPEHLELAPHLDRIADFSAAVADLDERASRQAADGAQSAGPSLLRCRAAGGGLGRRGPWCGRPGRHRGRLPGACLGFACRAAHGLVLVLHVASRTGGERTFAPDVAGEREAPGEDRSDPVAVASRERDVDEQPDHPAREAGQLYRSGRDDRAAAGDVGRRPAILVLQWVG